MDPQFNLFILGMLLFFPVYQITMFLHELGHAIPALIFSKRNVEVYLGSYGDKSDCFEFRFGKITFYLKRNIFFRRKRGLTVHMNGNISLGKEIFITACGPLFPAAIAISALYLSETFDVYGFLKLIVYLLCITAAIGVLANLFPNKKPVATYNGRNVYNDGYQLMQLLKQRKSEAAKKEEKCPDELYSFTKECVGEIDRRDLYRLSIAHCLRIKDYLKAEQFFQLLETSVETMGDEDYYKGGLVKYHLRKFSDAMCYLQSALAVNKRHHSTLNLMGYILLENEFYPESIKYFDSAINVDAAAAYPYNNKGYALLKLGDAEGALKYIKISLFLDKRNAYAYRNLGLYYLAKNETGLALRLFRIARKKDATVPLIDELMNDAQAGMHTITN